MKALLIISLLVTALFGCEVAPHDGADVQTTIENSAAPTDQGNNEQPAAQNGPAPVPPKADPSVPGPKPKPPEADAGSSTDTTPADKADTSVTDESATDEEIEGCGPMNDEPIACEWNYDCPPYDVPWMTNACVEGACVHDEVSVGFDYSFPSIDSSKLCVVIYRLRADGWWHGEEHNLPYSAPLKALCTSLEKDAYVSPQIADVVLAGTKRVEFAFVPCAGPQDENLIYDLPPSGLKIKEFPEYTSTVYKVGYNKDPLGGFEWSYIKGLGSDCWLYSALPDGASNPYLWE